MGPDKPLQEANVTRLAHLSQDERCEYLRIRDALLQRRDSFPLNASPTSTNSMLRAVLDDSPELFWFEGSWKLIQCDGKPFVFPIYTCDKSLLQHRKQEFEQALSQSPSYDCTLDPYHIALGLYDWMLEHVRYGCTFSSKGQTSYDSLVGRVALCKGIAKGYQLLLVRYGIASSLVRGSIGGEGKHVWNCLYQGQRNRYVDITLAHKQFDYLFFDSERNNRRRCFLMDRETVLRNGIVMEGGVRSCGC